MTCSRCHGLMFREPVPTRRSWIWLWVCFACGDRIDQTIWFHRSMRRTESIAERHDRLLREMQQLVQVVAVGV